MTVPIATSPGRSGFGPQLSLSYDSGSGNGPFGFGWSLSLPTITRKTDKGLPRYRDAEDSDVFILSGAEDLVPVYRQDSDGSWVAGHPGYQRDVHGFWVRDPSGRMVVHEDELDGYRVRRYRPRIEGLFARIERWSKIGSPSDVHWRSISKNNVLTLYGFDADSRIADPTDESRIFTWLICETRDDKGNAVLYRFKPEDGQGVDVRKAHERNRGTQNDVRRKANRYLKSIHYGNRTPLLDNAGHRPRFRNKAQIDSQFANADWMFEVVFDYGEHNATAPKPKDAGAWNYRQDQFSSYRSGFEIRTTRLCQRVLMFHHFPGEVGVKRDCLVRSTDFTYSDEVDPTDVRNPVYTFLCKVTQTGYRRNNGGYDSRSLPPVEFEYTEPVVQQTEEQVDSASLENLPVGLDGSTYRWTDLHGEGIPGILTEQAGAWFYKRNLSPIPERLPSGREHLKAQFAPLKTVDVKPNLALKNGAEFMDLAGDGQPDVVVLEGPISGLYEHDEAEGWQSFRPFSSRLNRDLRDPNARFIDLDGDGHTDVLITEEDAFVWYASLAEEGFEQARRVAIPLDEEKGPRVVFADGTQSIYLADLSGDGLSDIARIRNGEVCYWPNLGYGHFGAKVTMDSAPWFDQPDQFDHKRIRLADIDGTGTTDIIYLHRDGVRLYFNQSGNSWSKPQQLKAFPRIDEVVSITPIDLLGNGTACLVWSSPLAGDAWRPMRYVNLMGGQKPHLLVKAINNLGAETRVDYAPSTKFYLLDKRAAKPWVTRLPFPVQVVEKVTTYDHISQNRFVTRYAYHHGYFDGEEREFRGFGMVEQWDTEEIAALAGGNVLADNIAPESHVPPVHTKTWLHTGIYVGRDHASDYFAGLLDTSDHGEYFREPGLSDNEARALLLPDTVLPAGLTIEEEREACRALKGSMLRQEVYADDATPGANTPYTVTEQNFTVRAMQPRGSNRHAVFFTHARESLSYHYERNPADARIGHALTLEVDDFGNVLKSAAIGYGRRHPDPSLSSADQVKQAQILITWTENCVTNAVDATDDYRMPLPCESRTHELTGLTLLPIGTRFTFDEVLAAGTTAITLDYEKDPTSGRLEKRLIEHVRTYYRRNNLSGSLALGELQSLALSFKSYTLALTPGLVSEVYGGRVTDPMLASEGRYVHTEGDSNWWIPSEQIFYSPNPAHTAKQELAYARQHFFLPYRYRDPFYTNAVSTESFVTYDAYDLLVEETRDALGNRVTVGERNLDPTQPLVRHAQDYRVLQPALVMDPNRNCSEVRFDALGMVVGTALMGKPEENTRPGDRLNVTFRADLTQVEIDQFLATPKGPLAAKLLADATTRVVYDLTAYWREPDPAKKPPVVAATLARETHVSNLPAGQRTKIQVSLSYSDGFGREIQKKIQAEPGPVPTRDAKGKIIVGANGQPEMTPNSVSPRWVGSGWKVFNNKGKPIRKYEPFFTDTHLFEFDVKIGVSPVFFFDPVERIVATLHPNHTWEKVVIDPWGQETWDVNDTVMLDPQTDADLKGFVSNPDGTPRLPIAEYQPSWHDLRTDATNAAAFKAQYPDPTDRANETRAAEKAAVHAATPTVAYADTLGRTFLTISNNKFKYSNTPAASPPTEESYKTRVILDIEGNQREVIDAKDRILIRYLYDMLSNRIHQASMEAGDRWMLNDVAGKPIRRWDSRGFLRRMTYDELRRPIELYVTDSGAERLAEQVVYGETQDEALNHRGRIYQQFDQVGIVTHVAYDFKGNVLQSRRQVARQYKTAPDWSAGPTLEKETFTSHLSYDALNRPVQSIVPHSDRVGTKVNVIEPIYNDATLLEQLHVWLNIDTEPSGWLKPDTADLHAIGNIDYNAKGQRELIEYGNGTSTAYEYDPNTFRLTKLMTTRTSDSALLQDLNYIYDPEGNVTHVRDGAQQTLYFRNKRVNPSADYTYDSLYRLIEATGREHLGQNGRTAPNSYNDAPRVGLLHPGDGNAMGTYLERYLYDEAGNFLKMQHEGTDPANPGWSRSYAYNEASLVEPTKQSNRLSLTTIGVNNPIREQYTYDAHGNMTSMPHLPLMQWNYCDQLHVTAQQARHDGGTPETTYDVYESTGERVRKVTDRQAAAGQTPTRVKERIYLGGFEIYREYENDGDTVRVERETLHIMDDQQCIALVERRTKGTDPAPALLIRYQFDNHLGSVSLELGHKSQVISYEEYTPYGSSSYQAVRSQTETPKRYRYTGKERDEESGLYYHGARFYAAWLGRWVACDPAGLADGLDLYVYCRWNPATRVDDSGKQSGVPSTKRKVRARRKPSPSRKGTARGVARSIMAVQRRSGVGGALQAADIALRDLYKLTNAERAAAVHQIIKDLEATPQQATEAGTMAWSASGLRNLLRAATQGKLTPVGKILSRLLEKDRSWAKIVKKYGDPFDVALPAEQRLKIADDIAAASARSSASMNALQAFGKGLMVLNVLLSAVEIGGGINKIRSGHTGEGVVDTTEGSTNAALTIGTYAGVKNGTIVVAEGTGFATFVSGLVAAGSLALAFGETRRTLRGQKTMAAEARDYYQSVQDRVVKEGPSFSGAVKYVGSQFGKDVSGFIASGQKDLWGLLSD